MTCRLKAPTELFNSTVSVEDGSVYQIPDTGIIYADKGDMMSLLALGFWPYRDVDEQFDQGALGGGGGTVADPGDLTVLFDNALL